MTCRHTWKRTFEDKGGFVEDCTRCGQREGYRYNKFGRIDNNRYLKNHAVDFAQPGGATDKLFREVYGEKHAEQSTKINKPQIHAY